MSDSLDELLRHEEAKRDANWDPVQRWRVIQEFLTWSEQQATVRRNTPEACLREQRRKLRELGEMEPADASDGGQASRK